MPLTSKNTGDSITASDHNEIYNLLKTTTAKEWITFTHHGADIASAGTLTLGADGNYFHVTGTTGITAISTRIDGTLVILEFDGALTLTHNATSLILLGGVNVTTVAGDVFAFISEGSGNWREVDRRKIATATAPGFVPTPPNNTTTFLRGDATWAAPPAGALTLISETVLSVATASFDFTSIPSTYKHLKLIGTVKSAVAASEAVVIRFNNDSGANYDDEYVRGGSASASAAAEAGATRGWIGVADGVNGNPIEISIPSYARTTLVKGALCTSYQTANQIVATHGMRWNSTAAINRITIYQNSGNNFDTGSTMALYGIS